MSRMRLLSPKPFDRSVVLGWFQDKGMPPNTGGYMPHDHIEDETGAREHAQEGYRPSVILKFKDSVKLPYIDAVESYLLENKLGDWAKLVEISAKFTLRRLFTALIP